MHIKKIIFLIAIIYNLNVFYASESSVQCDQTMEQQWIELLENREFDKFKTLYDTILEPTTKKIFEKIVHTLLLSPKRLKIFDPALDEFLDEFLMDLSIPESQLKNLLNALSKEDRKTAINCLDILHYAVFQGNIDLIQFLIDAGADIEHHNESDDTPLSLAYEIGNLECAELLLRSTETIQDYKTIHIALQNERLTDLLVKHRNKIASNQIPEFIDFCVNQSCQPVDVATLTPEQDSNLYTSIHNARMPNFILPECQHTLTLEFLFFLAQERNIDLNVEYCIEDNAKLESTSGILCSINILRILHKHLRVRYEHDGPIDKDDEMLNPMPDCIRKFRLIAQRQIIQEHQESVAIQALTGHEMRRSNEITTTLYSMLGFKPRI